MSLGPYGTITGLLGEAAYGPIDVSNAIQGHTSGHVSESYGSCYSLKVMGEWLEKAYGEIGLTSS